MHGRTIQEASRKINGLENNRFAVFYGIVVFFFGEISAHWLKEINKQMNEHISCQDVKWRCKEGNLVVFNENGKWVTYGKCAPVIWLHSCVYVTTHSRIMPESRAQALSLNKNESKLLSTVSKHLTTIGMRIKLAPRSSCVGAIHDIDLLVFHSCLRRFLMPRGAARLWK